MRSTKFDNIEGARIVLNTMLQEANRIQVIHIDSCVKGGTNVPDYAGFIDCSRVRVGYDDDVLCIEDISEENPDENIYTAIPIIYVNKVVITEDNKQVVIKWIVPMEDRSYVERCLVVRVSKDTVMPRDIEYGFGYQDWPDNLPVGWKERVLRDWYKITAACGVNIPFKADDATVSMANAFVEMHNKGLKEGDDKWIGTPGQVYCSGRYI